MASDDWFRNEVWTPTISGKFFEKLRRARNKAQYLKIQSFHLTESHPSVARDLLEQYFSLDDHFDDAQAFFQQAQAYVVLGKREDAIICYQKALQRERDFPHSNSITRAWCEYALLVATHKIEALYEDVLKVLEQRKGVVAFPVDEFLWYGTHALIESARGRRELAQDYADKALQAAGKQHSGFRYHPDVGLVAERYASVLKDLQRLVSGNWWQRLMARE
jgi:tetratricopeptide (TPR) repeat protein